MAQNNKVAFRMPDNEAQKVRDAINVLDTVLTPRLTRLTTGEKQELNKLGPRRYLFVEKGLELARGNAGLVPSFVKVEELETDLNAVKSLRPIADKLRFIADALDDTILLSGSEALEATLFFYGNVKNEAKAHSMNAESILAELSSLYNTLQSQKANKKTAKA